jgi:hypothetical protein
MQGHLLGASHSTAYFINRAQSGVFVNQFGSTNVTNVAIADNNSPIPRDRISFRYNHFDNAQSVNGLADSPPVFDPSLPLGARRQDLATRNFDFELYTFQFEKTFFDGLMSAELRLPFSTGLSSNLNLSVGTQAGQSNARVALPAGNFLYGYYNTTTGQNNSVQGGANQNSVTPPTGTTTPLQAFTVNRTPRDTLGTYATEFGNLTGILKGVVYRDDAFLLSGGLGLGIPTADDTHLRITDYVGGATNVYAEAQRTCDITIHNDAWSLSPFLAAVYAPDTRFFTQGFLQFDLPLGGNGYSYGETLTYANNSQARINRLGLTPIGAQGTIDEQVLMQVDLGTGYWVLRDSENRWLTGLAPTIELHYTTTLDDADLITLPADNSRVAVQGAVKSPPGRGSARRRVATTSST